MRAEAALIGCGADEILVIPPDLRPSRVSPSRRWVIGGTAAGLAAVCVGVALPFRSAHRLRSFTSELGEIRHVPLEDGSRLTMNTDSTLSVDYARDRRTIRLMRGEAFFEVAKDPARPFIVVGPNAQVRTVGTAYSVRLTGGDEMRVLVAAGKVAIETVSETAGAISTLEQLWRSGAEGARAVFVEAGQVAKVWQGKGGEEGNGLLVAVASLAKDTPQRALLWREGQLYLEGQTLAQAVSEFARYSRRRIVIADPALGETRVTGLFAAGDPEGFARAIALSLGAHVVRRADSIVLAR
ncbi:MAG TPA: FecR domain-containing protein [Rhizomicrobium sp.]